MNSKKAKLDKLLGQLPDEVSWLTEWQVNKALDSGEITMDEAISRTQKLAIKLS